MKYKFMFILTIIFLSFGVYIVNGEEYTDGDILNFKYDNVVCIEVKAGGPYISEHRKYNYSTTSENEIKYILHYINSFNLVDDGITVQATDVSNYSVIITMSDNTTERVGFFYNRFYDNSGKQYGINRNEYNYFFDFISGLKEKQIILDNEVTFETSEWAKNDVDTAIKNLLVPKLYQINYKGEISRREVCHLIYNLVELKNSVTFDTIQNPFSDTSDVDVLNLYELGIVNGKSSTEFLPHDTVTREELAKILCKAYDILMNGSEFETQTTAQFTDNQTISEWAKLYVAKINNLEILIGDQNGNFNPKECCTKEQVIVAVLRLYKIIL